MHAWLLVKVTLSLLWFSTMPWNVQYSPVSVLLHNTNTNTKDLFIERRNFIGFAKEFHRKNERLETKYHNLNRS